MKINSDPVPPSSLNWITPIFSQLVSQLSPPFFSDSIIHLSSRVISRPSTHTHTYTQRLLILFSCLYPVNAYPVITRRCKYFMVHRDSPWPCIPHQPFLLFSHSLVSLNIFQFLTSFYCPHGSCKCYSLYLKQFYAILHFFVS